jgi:hypothetical protein
VLGWAIRFLTDDPDSSQPCKDVSGRWDALPWSSLKHVKSAIDEAVTSFAEFAEVTRDVMDAMTTKKQQAKSDPSHHKTDADAGAKDNYALEGLDEVRLARFRQLCTSGSKLTLLWLKENTGSDESSIQRIQQRRTWNLVLDVIPWMVSLNATARRDGDMSGDLCEDSEWDSMVPALVSVTEADDEEASERLCSALLAREDALVRLAQVMTAHVQQVTNAMSRTGSTGSSSVAFSADKLVAFAFRAIDLGKVLLIVSLSADKGCAAVAKATARGRTAVATDQLCVCVKSLLDTHLNGSSSNSFPVTGLDSELTKRAVVGIMGHMLALSSWLSFGCVQSAGTVGVASSADERAGIARSSSASLEVLRRVCAEVTTNDYAEIADVNDQVLPLIQMCCERRC